jgi:hypothetical protein
VKFDSRSFAVCFRGAFADDKFWAQDLNCGANGFPLDHLQQHVHAGCTFCDKVVMDRGKRRFEKTGLGQVIVTGDRDLIRNPDFAGVQSPESAQSHMIIAGNDGSEPTRTGTD